MNSDKFGDKQKEFERRETSRVLCAELPVLARIDGKCFHSFTRQMQKPFDERLISTFQETTKRLVMETNATLGYQQSDEISLAWTKGHLFFDGKLHKMLSVLASMATAYFSQYMKIFLPNCEQIALFDCRVWEVPNLERATEYFEWREADAVKNSISMAAYSLYSHNELHEKTSSERQDLLMLKGVNWNDYSDACKRGTYYGKITEKKRMSKAELAELPSQHNARKNPELEFERTYIRRLNIPPLSKIENKSGVLYDGQDYITIAC